MTLSTKNLVVNPGAKLGPVSTDFSTNTPPQGWVVSGTFTGVTYAAGGPSDLNAAHGLALQGGTSYFAGGTSSLAATATQWISVKSMASEIDTGTVGATISGQFGGYPSQDDAMTLIVRFLGANGVSQLGQVTLIGPDHILRGSESTLLLSEDSSAFIHAGTRFIEVTMSANRASGTYNDAYADNIAVDLTGVTTGSVLVAATHSITADTIQTADGVVFDATTDAVATFLSSQFGPTHIALNGRIEGSTNADLLAIKLDATGFSAAQFKFANWTSGPDQLLFTGKALAEAVTGSSQADHFIMAGGADTVAGGSGNNVIDDGAGHDVLRGNAGADEFILATSSASRDHIADFVVDVDDLAVPVSAFGLAQAAGTTLGSAFLNNTTGLAQGAEDRFIYQSTTGKLFFDADGTGAGAAKEIAFLAGAPVLTESDFLLIA